MPVETGFNCQLDRIKNHQERVSVRSCFCQVDLGHVYGELSWLLNEVGGWRDGSEVKSIACSFKGPEFNSQQPHGGSQPSVKRSGALFWPAGIHTDRILYT